MKNRIIALVVGTVLLLCSSLPAQAPDTLWTRTYGGFDEDMGRSVRQISTGGYIILGYTWTFGQDPPSIYLIRTKENGDTVWTNTYGGVGDDVAYCVQETSDGGFIICGYCVSGGVRIIKVNKDGIQLWSETYGGGKGYSIKETNDKGFIIAGYFGISNRNVCLIKTDSLGNCLWTRSFGGLSNDEGRAVLHMSNDGYIIVGWTESYGAGNKDIYVIRTDENGDSLWTKTFGGDSSDIGYSIQQASDNGFLIVGATKSWGSGDFDVYISKVDSLGDLMWTKLYGGLLEDRGYAIEKTMNDQYIICGWTYSFGSLNSDIYLLKVDENGDTAWTTRYGVGFWEEAYSCQQTQDGGYIIAGDIFGYNLTDVYLIKTEADVGIREHQNQQDMSKDMLLTCRPNPFVSTTQIKLLGTNKNHKSNLTIYDVSGRQVKEISLLPFNFSLGATWDGRDDAGQVLPPGIYFLKLNGKPAGKVVKVK
jgi:hypothetical protein